MTLPDASFIFDSNPGLSAAAGIISSRPPSYTHAEGSPDHDEQDARTATPPVKINDLCNATIHSLPSDTSLDALPSRSHSSTTLWESSSAVANTNQPTKPGEAATAAISKDSRSIPPDAESNEAEDSHFIDRVTSTIPLISQISRVYCHSKQSNPVLKYTSDVMEEGAKKVLRRSSGYVNWKEVDEFACRTWDRFGPPGWGKEKKTQGVAERTKEGESFDLDREEPPHFMPALTPCQCDSDRDQAAYSAFTQADTGYNHNHKHKSHISLPPLHMNGHSTVHLPRPHSSHNHNDPRAQFGPGPWQQPYPSPSPSSSNHVHNQYFSSCPHLRSSHAYHSPSDPSQPWILASPATTLPGRTDMSTSMTGEGPRETPKSKWQQVLQGGMTAAGATTAVVSEEAMNSLKICLQWLQYAMTQINARVSILRTYLVPNLPAPELYPRITFDATSADKIDRSSSATTANGSPLLSSEFKPNACTSSSSRFPMQLTLNRLKMDIVEAIRRAVDVLGKYAGQFLNDEARERVRGFLLSLPGRWANFVHESCDTHLEAQNILSLATESLTMLRSIREIFEQSLATAEAWVARLRWVGQWVRQGDHSGERLAPPPSTAVTTTEATVSGGSRSRTAAAFQPDDGCSCTSAQMEEG